MFCIIYGPYLPESPNAFYYSIAIIGVGLFHTDVWQLKAKGAAYPRACLPEISKNQRVPLFGPPHTPIRSICLVFRTLGGNVGRFWLIRLLLRTGIVEGEVSDCFAASTKKGA